MWANSALNPLNREGKSDMETKGRAPMIPSAGLVAGLLAMG
jgi:hypothetical protein